MLWDQTFELSVDTRDNTLLNESCTLLCNQLSIDKGNSDGVYTCQREFVS